MTFRELVTKPLTRSSGWSGVRSRHIRREPQCAVCRRRKDLEVHHIEDYSTRPELELEDSNLITLCSGSTKCHFVFGHLGNWRSINPDVVEDAETFEKKMRERR